jgi:hypothetical protein
MISEHILCFCYGEFVNSQYPARRFAVKMGAGVTDCFVRAIVLPSKQPINYSYSKVSDFSYIFPFTSRSSQLRPLFNLDLLFTVTQYYLLFTDIM